MAQADPSIAPPAAPAAPESEPCARPAQARHWPLFLSACLCGADVPLPMETRLPPRSASCPHRFL
ncbi:conserved hypothetical protein [Ricinus communis]|uniref:Uncharacterized protein n=1 Tax=Ricinus communis TaxID=3988 RepID=B9T8V5_RICCO|nr:conserved hypothetical protein [Ricinus communis]